MALKIPLLLLSFSILANQVRAQEANLKISPINFSRVVINDDFWKPKIDKVSTATLAACIYQTEQNTGRIRNFEKVARKKGELHEGVFYDDSDVYKAIEAMAYAIKMTGNKSLETKADEWIDKIAAAQQPDGYLNTYYTLTGLDKRWSDMDRHEDYCGGHMIEAAVAYLEATGKRKFFDVAVRWANHFDATFGSGKQNWVTGHQELELALVKLYRVTKEQKYLKLADWLLLQRGNKLGVGAQWQESNETSYSQDLMPVKQQSEITGHAVRAMYLYTGAADVAAYTGDQDYLKAMRRVWEDVVFRNMYITGAIGSAGSNEGFSKDYDLPNEHAYGETCASVGMVFWNQRMNSLTGSAEYIDVLERSLYNGALDGLSLSGDRFFYGNPLASTGQHSRSEWFGTACCPSNISRLITSLGNYVYGQHGNKIFVNLFVGSSAKFALSSGEMGFSMQTSYPWSGNLVCKVSVKKKQTASIAFRIPGWAQNNPVPGELYAFADRDLSKPELKVNGRLIQYTTQDGYAVITRQWKNGDLIEYSLPMPVRKVIGRNELTENKDRIAIQRGPIVYCVEGADNQGAALNIIAPSSASFRTEAYTILDEKVLSVVADLPVVEVAANGVSVQTTTKKVRAIPYYTWCNRGSNQMQVWLPSKVKDIKLNY